MRLRADEVARHECATAGTCSAQATKRGYPLQGGSYGSIPSNEERLKIRSAG